MPFSTRLWPSSVLLVGLLAVTAGCSTHPCADFHDYFHRGKIYPNAGFQQYGGVCIPQNPVVPPTPMTAPIGFPGATPGVLPNPGLPPITNVPTSPAISVPPVPPPPPPPQGGGFFPR